MKTLLSSVSVAAAASLLAFGPALAQSEGSDAGASGGQNGAGGEQQMAQGQPMQGGGKSAGEITCAEIIAMDTTQVPGVLYYISGFRAGQGGEGQYLGLGGSDQTGGTGGEAMAPQASVEGSDGTQSGDAPGAADAGSSDSMQAAGDAGGGGATQATGDAGAGDAMQAGDAGAGGEQQQGDAMQAAGGSDAASGSGEAMQGGTETAGGTDASGGGGMSGDSSGGQVQVTRVAGYFEIPIERAMIACGEAPEQRASDVIEQQRPQN